VNIVAALFRTTTDEEKSGGNAGEHGK